MSIKKSLIKNTSFNLAGYFYLLLASFFSITYLLNNFGRDVFGVYIFLSGFIPLAAVFDLGISNAVIRKLSLPNLSINERNQIWQTAFYMYIVLAATLSVLVTIILLYLTSVMPIFAHIDKSTLNIAIMFIATIIFVNNIDNHFLNLAQAQQKFDTLNTKTLLVGTANTFISAGVTFYLPNIALVYCAQLIFHLITVLIMYRYAKKTFTGKSIFPQFNLSAGKELLSFGLRNFVGTLASQIENQFSNIVLGAMVSAQAIASFSIPQSIVVKGAGVVSQFAQVFFPLSTSLITKDRIMKLRLLVLGTESFILVAGILAVLASYAFGLQFLSWWLRDPVVVALAYPILKILSFYFVLISLTPIPTALVQGLNKPQISSFFAVLTVTIEIISSIFLVPKFQTIGIAYAFLISASISVPLFLIVSWRLLRREIHKFHSESLLPPATI